MAAKVQKSKNTVFYRIFLYRLFGVARWGHLQRCSQSPSLAVRCKYCRRMQVLSYDATLVLGVLYNPSVRPQTIYIGIYGKIRCFGILGLWRPFLFFCGVPEAREVFKNLPGAHGFVVLQYGPVASHGDPIHTKNCG